MKRNTGKKYVVAGQLLFGVSAGVILSIIFVHLWGSSGIGYAIVSALFFTLIGGVIGDMIFKSKQNKQ